jgi:hypothetical protein
MSEHPVSNFAPFAHASKANEVVSVIQIFKRHLSCNMITEYTHFSECCSHKFCKAVPLHAMEALGGRGDIAPTHSQPRH